MNRKQTRGKMNMPEKMWGRRYGTAAVWIFAGLFWASCAAVHPRGEDGKAATLAPRTANDACDGVLGRFGLMTEIYGAPQFRIRCGPTGGAGGEAKYGLSQEITEMMKSALNQIGGRVIYSAGECDSGEGRGGVKIHA